MFEAALRVEPLESWTGEKLGKLVEGSSPKLWQRWLPELVKRRVLVKRGKTWLGRRSQIEAALLSPENA